MFFQTSPLRRGRWFCVISPRFNFVSGPQFYINSYLLQQAKNGVMVLPGARGPVVRRRNRSAAGLHGCRVRHCASVRLPGRPPLLLSLISAVINALSSGNRSAVPSSRRPAAAMMTVAAKLIWPVDERMRACLTWHRELGGCAAASATVLRRW